MQQIITALAESQTIKEIALNLGIADKTVFYFWTRAKERFNLRSYQDAVRYALKQGWTKL